MKTKNVGELFLTAVEHAECVTMGKVWAVAWFGHKHMTGGAFKTLGY